MSVMGSFTLRSLKKNRMRTVVSIVGIALSCALITAVYVSVSSIQGGLLQRTIDTEGSWQVYTPAISQDTYETFRQSENVTNLATARDLGFAKLAKKDSDVLGDFVVVRTLLQAGKGSLAPEGSNITMMPKLEEGHMPETESEVVLPDYFEGEVLGAGAQDAGVVSSDALAVGSTLTLGLGMRVVDENGEQRVLSSVESSFAPSGKGAGSNEERLVDVEQRTYTVVGFYKRQAPFIGNSFTGAASAATALTSADASGEGLLNAYLTTQGFGSQEELRSFVDASMGETDGEAFYHSTMMPYQGILDGRSLWGSLWFVAAVIAVVIVVASVSLIYNSFAISVADRTRQFGLLSSIGASKKQLRRSVLVEALLLGLVGIPLGVALGTAGTAGVFSLTQDAFAAMLGGEKGLALTLDPMVLVGVALLSLATLLVSAWVPARRAGKVSAIDAVRQTQDVRMSKRAARRARAAGEGAVKSEGSSSLLKAGLAGKLFSVSGFMAHRNLARSSARGRTVVASLAISVLLIVVAGGVTTYLTPLSDRASSIGAAGSGADIVVTAGSSRMEALNNLEEELDGFLAEAQRIDGVSSVNSYKQGQAQAAVPASMVSEEGRAAREDMDRMRKEDWMPPSFSSTGDCLGGVEIFYIDEASWIQLAQEVGVDGSAAIDPAHPRAIALNRYQGSFPDGTYADVKPFVETGSIDLYAMSSNVYWDENKWASLGLREASGGGLAVGYINSNSKERLVVEKPIAEVASKTTVEVIALASKEPASVNAAGAASDFPVLIMPESVATAAGAGYGAVEIADEVVPSVERASAASGGQGLYDYGRAGMSFAAADHAKAAESLEALAANYKDVSITVSDVAESAEQNRMVVQAVQLFIFCFSVIMLLIAVANVFNTLTNSIVLRAREFAVLKSVGMGDRAFARMLVYECASYAVRGFSLGVLVAAAATFLLYQAARMSFTGLAFELPWPSVGAAVVVVLVVLVLSVVFALHKSHASSVVDALRADAL